MVYINNHEFGSKKFPNGESVFEFDVKNLKDIRNTITLMFETDADLFAMMMANRYLMDKRRSAERILYMPYIPYSRMDREINNQVFSLKYFGELIKQQKFREVIVMDPHSSVSKNHIKFIEMQVEYDIAASFQDFNADYMFFPDKGAYTKYSKKRLLDKYTSFYGEKVRDLDNKGEIIGYEIHTNGLDIRGKRVLIVDDICCKGGTAYHAAIKLKEQGVQGIGFWIAHCENSIFYGDILNSEAIERVYTTNSILSKLKVVDIKLQREPNLASK